MIHRVKAGYKVFLQEGYQRVKYKSKVIKMELPIDKNGFILMVTLGDKIADYLKTVETNDFQILNYSILD